MAYSRGCAVLGFERGWEGLLQNDFKPLTPRSVGGILGLGGTILRTARSREFRTPAGLAKAAETLSDNKVEGLIVIGGDGSCRGAYELSKNTETLIAVVPASIDNDLYGSDETIGFDTAVNTAVSEIDKIRDTAISHERIFIIEVMGRMRGFLALAVGITAGAEVILVPEVKPNKANIYGTIEENREKGKRSGIIVIAEGAGDSHKLASQIEKHTGSEVRLSVLGYAQRGGSQTARSRLLACTFGSKAVELLIDGRRSKLVGNLKGKLTTTDLKDSCSIQKRLDLSLLDLAKTLAT
jgi:6-phosphofructokinase 1